MFHARVFGLPSESAASYLEWKYHRNPYWGSRFLYLARFEDEIVASRGMFGSNWEDNAGHTVVPCAADLGVHPEHRDQGLLQSLAERVIDDLAAHEHSLALNLSATPANYITSVVTLGWRPVGRYVELTRPGDRRLTSSRRRLVASGRPWLERAGKSLRPMAAKAQARLRVRARMSRLRSVVADRVFRTIDQTDVSSLGPLSVSSAPRADEIASLISQIEWDGRARHVRDTQYLNWRYANPRSEYRFLYWGDPEIEGYVALQSPVGRNRVSIVDIEAFDPDVAMNLILASSKLTENTDLTMWSATLPESMARLLLETGFHPPDGVAAGRRGMLMRAIGPERSGPSLADRHALEDWDLRMIYSDSY